MKENGIWGWSYVIKGKYVDFCDLVFYINFMDIFFMFLKVY